MLDGGTAAPEAKQPGTVVVASPPDVTGQVVIDSLRRFPDAVVLDIASVKGAIAAEDLFHQTSLGPAVPATYRRLADQNPTRLAIMHGSSYDGDCPALLRAMLRVVDSGGQAAESDRSPVRGSRAEPRLGPRTPCHSLTWPPWCSTATIPRAR